MRMGIRLHNGDERWPAKEHKGKGGATETESLADSRPSAGARWPRRFLTLLLLPLCLALMVFAAAAQAAQVTLAWNANTETNISGYKVYYGTASRDYDWSIDAGRVTTYTVPNLTNGVTYFFAVTAYNASRVESTYSGEVSNSTCTYSISPTTKSFTGSGGTGTVTVTTQTGCPWTASSGVSWLTITSGKSGTGNGTINYSVVANTGTSSRTASSTFARNQFTVTQQAGTTGTQSSVVIDDGQSGTTTVGTWRVSGAPNPYGTRSLYIYSTTATYTFQASRSGQQGVYLWWTTHSSRNTRVPVRIYNGSTLVATVYVNQTQNGGKWNYLGSYSFSGLAQVRVMSTSSSLTTCADAVRFVPSP